MGRKKGKPDKQSRRAKREQEQAEHAHLTAALERRQRTMRVASLAIPGVTVVTAVVTYLVTESAGLAAFVGLVGVGIWMPVLLGALGSAVPPRDRARAGSIDFGQRR